jgi:hypothetical protein
LHNFKTTDINGNEFDFSQLAGKKVLIVNTASECGYTPHFAQLEELHKEFPQLDAQRFHDFYTAKGWMIGKNKMKDWKATARNWMRNDKKETNQQGYKKLTLDD